MRPTSKIVPFGPISRRASAPAAPSIPVCRRSARSAARRGSSPARLSHERASTAPDLSADRRSEPETSNSEPGTWNLELRTPVTDAESLTSRGPGQGNPAHIGARLVFLLGESHTMQRVIVDGKRLGSLGHQQMLTWKGHFAILKL